MEPDLTPHAIAAPALLFTVPRARVERYAAAPTLVLTLRVEEISGAPVEGAALRAQLRLEPQGRRYRLDEEESLTELFGATSRWGRTMRPLAWVEAALLLPAFTGHVEIELPIACSGDLEVSANRYFHALREGEVPVRLLFRGSVFRRGARGLEMTPLPWDREALWRLPIRLWREALDSHFPDGGWLRLGRETLDALVRFKGERALPTCDAALATLLAEARRA